MRRAALLLLLASSCGSVTPATSSSSDAGLEAAAELGQADAGDELAPELEAGITDLQVEQLELGPHCAELVSSAGYAAGALSCAACTNQGVSIEQNCRAFIDCVRDSTAAAPLVDCHARLEGTSGAHAVDDCARALLEAACP